MKKIILLSSIALVGLLSACDDDYSNQFNIDAPITDVKNSTFTLLSSDYPEVAGLAENQETGIVERSGNWCFCGSFECGRNQ